MQCSAWCVATVRSATRNSSGLVATQAAILKASPPLELLNIGVKFEGNFGLGWWEVLQAVYRRPEHLQFVRKNPNDWSCRPGALRRARFVAKFPRIQHNHKFVDVIGLSIRITRRHKDTFKTGFWQDAPKTSVPKFTLDDVHIVHGKNVPRVGGNLNIWRAFSVSIMLRLGFPRL